MYVTVKTVNDPCNVYSQLQLRLQDLLATIATADRVYEEQKEFIAAEDHEIGKVDRQLDSLREDIANIEQKGHAAKSAKIEFLKEKEQMRRRLLQLNNAMESAEAGAARVLQDAMLESVELPGASCEGGEDGVRVPDCFCFDFSELPEGMSSTAASTRQRNLEQLRDEIEQLRHQIDTMSPNLKAPEEYEYILQEEKDLKAVRFRHGLI